MIHVHVIPNADSYSSSGRSVIPPGTDLETNVRVQVFQRRVESWVFKVANLVTKLDEVERESYAATS